MRSFLFCLVTLAIFASTAAGQVYCPEDYCPRPPAIGFQGQIDQLIAQRLANAQKMGPASRAAVRVRAGNSCGSGSICGYFRGGSLVLTNAHVVGTRVGRQVNIEAVVDDRRQVLIGRVIMAAYSDRTLTDWAVVYVEGFRDIEPVLLSKNIPNGTHYTRGSPRCVWPLVDTPVVTAEIADNSPLWRWRPNSIGGQSGSGVWSTADNYQYGLLTWSWGGLGAGQQTAQIYRQSKERSTDAPQRIPGLQAVMSEDVVLENGFFQQADIDTLPIWAGEGNDGDSDPPGDDGCEGADTEEGRLIKQIRDRARERGIDLLALLQVILQLLEILGSR